MSSENRLFWESKHDTELWFGGRHVVTLEFRPGINLQQKRLFAERLEVLLNATRQTDDILIRSGP